MSRYIIRRLMQMLVVLLLASVGIFLIVHILPGDAALVYAGPNATDDVVAAVRHTMGLDQSLPVQYIVWFGHVMRGDLGKSYVNGFTVTRLLLQRLPVTLELALASILISLVIAVPTGILAAIKQGSVFDYFVTGLNGLGLAIPPFWFGLILILVVALGFHWLPASGYADPSKDLGGALKHLILPTVTLSFQVAAILSRFMKSVTLDVLQEDYVRTARAKGLGSRAVLLSHAPRNALVPVITVVALELPSLVGGAVIIEQI
ncbi:MAG: peptide ABC transporter, partial [Chloroflexi bacterium]